MRGRFNPGDGHLYVVGLDGWQTAAVRDGCFQRVRATGKPMHLPTELKIRNNGIEISFSDSLDSKTATEVGNWKIEQWNYRWTKEYGSEHYSVSNPDSLEHDSVKIHKIELSPSGRTVYLAIDEIKPVMQMNIKADLKSANGSPLPVDIFNSINRVPNKHP